MNRGLVRPARPTWRAQLRAFRMRGRRRLTARALREALAALTSARWVPTPPVPMGALWEPMLEES